MAEPLEPTVSGPDVAALLRPHVTEDDNAAMLADKTGYSTRTIWRVLDDPEEWMELEKADTLLTAIRESVNSCHLRYPDGRVEEPWFGE